jgi:hypothetical protein
MKKSYKYKANKLSIEATGCGWIIIVAVIIFFLALFVSGCTKKDNSDEISRRNQLAVESARRQGVHMHPVGDGVFEIDYYDKVKPEQQSLRDYGDSVIVIEYYYPDTTMMSKREYEQFKKGERNSRFKKKSKYSTHYESGPAANYPNYKYSPEIRRYLWENSK